MNIVFPDGRHVTAQLVWRFYGPLTVLLGYSDGSLVKHKITQLFESSQKGAVSPRASRIVSLAAYACMVFSLSTALSGLLLEERNSQMVGFSTGFMTVD